MTATTAPNFTKSPSRALISLNRPSSGASISTLTLSVSTSSSASPFLTLAPGSLIQRRIRTSSLSSLEPKRGTMTSFFTAPNLERLRLETVGQRFELQRLAHVFHKRVEVMVFRRDLVFYSRVEVVELRKDRHVGDGHALEHEFLPGVDLVQSVKMDIPLLFDFFARFRSLGTPHRMVGKNQHFVGPIFQS